MNRKNGICPSIRLGRVGFYSLLVVGLVFTLNSGCKKEAPVIDLKLPVVTTSAVSAITATSATCGGYITKNTLSIVIERGVCWSKSSTPTIADEITTDGNGDGNFISTISGLDNNTTYYIRAYATNTEGTGYGNVRSFKTLSIPVPVLTTYVVGAITPYSASCGGNITSEGGSAVTERGVCWSTGANPKITDPKSSDGTGTGSFTSAVTGLTPVTTYYVRAYATNSGGTGYGNVVSFKTDDSFYVSKTETNRVAVLEAFSGVRCTYCPDGYAVSKSIADANPGKFIIISLHGGSYAEPQTGWPNFTTLYGNALISQAKVTGYPAGTISRMLGSVLGVTPQVTNGFALGRDNWATATSFVLTQKAPVNIGAKATFNSTTR